MNNENEQNLVDETGYINTEELREVLNEKQEAQKKENWFQKLIKKFNKKNK